MNHIYTANSWRLGGALPKSPSHHYTVLYSRGPYAVSLEAKWAELRFRE